MDDKLAYELCEHTYYSVKWILQYIKGHGLRFEETDRPDILEFHLNRIDSIFNEIEKPLKHNPILSSPILQRKSSDERYHHDSDSESDEEVPKPLVSALLN
jgi:hypothetical protein